MSSAQKSRILVPMDTAKTVLLKFQTKMKTMQETGIEDIGVTVLHIITHILLISAWDFIAVKNGNRTFVNGDERMVERKEGEQEKK